MRARQFTYLALRLFALYFIIQILLVLPAALSYAVASEYESWDALIPLVLQVGLTSAVALTLWFRTEWFIDRIFVAAPVYDEEAPEEEERLEDEGDEPNEIEENEIEENEIEEEEYIYESSPRLAIGDIQAVAFSIIGIWFLAGAIPDLVAYLDQLTGNEPLPGDIGTLFDMFVGIRAIQFWPLIARIVIGMVLFFNARGLAAFWSRLRTAGRHEVSSISHEPEGKAER